VGKLYIHLNCSNDCGDDMLSGAIECGRSVDDP